MQSEFNVARTKACAVCAFLHLSLLTLLHCYTSCCLSLGRHHLIMPFVSERNAGQGRHALLSRWVSTSVRREKLFSRRMQTEAKWAKRAAFLTPSLPLLPIAAESEIRQALSVRSRSRFECVIAIRLCGVRTRQHQRSMQRHAHWHTFSMCVECSNTCDDVILLVTTPGKLATAFLNFALSF